MICNNCQKEVDNDLVFCTECGARLHETISGSQTVIQPESVVTKVSQSTPKPKSNLKWIALIVALITLPASLGIIFLIYKNLSNQQVSNKPANNSANTANRKTPSQNKTANTPVNISNADWTNTNSKVTNENTEKESPKPPKVIIDERINIYADSSIAFPFTVDEQVKIIGKTEIVHGEKFAGYVFLQEVYDEHQVNPNYKVFSFEGDQVEQFLPKGNYVLVFADSDGKGVSLKTKFTITPQGSDKN